MSFFSSNRERRLWLWLVIVMVGIYTTLGQVPALRVALRERDRDNLVFNLFVALVVVAVLLLHKHRGRIEIAIGIIGILIIFVTAWLRIGSLEERTHLFEYGFVAALVHEALIERRQNGRRVPAPAILALVVSIMLGWIDEGIQSILPNRVYDIRDVFFNTVAAGMVIGARWVLALVWRWVQGKRDNV